MGQIHMQGRHLYIKVYASTFVTRCNSECDNMGVNGVCIPNESMCVSLGHKNICADDQLTLIKSISSKSNTNYIGLGDMA